MDQYTATLDRLIKKFDLKTCLDESYDENGQDEVGVKKYNGGSLGDMEEARLGRSSTIATPPGKYHNRSSIKHTHHCKVIVLLILIMRKEVKVRIELAV